LIIAGREFSSRLIIGTGKYRSYEQMRSAHEASGAEMVTVAVRRVPLDRSSESFLDYLSPALQILPNTAGCYTAEDAVRTARLAREALQTDLVKLEVIGDQTTLFPDNEQTLEAARILVKEGFVVLQRRSDHGKETARRRLRSDHATRRSDRVGARCSESSEPAHYA
jgi:thiazole synthase